MYIVYIVLLYYVHIYKTDYTRISLIESIYKEEGESVRFLSSRI